MPTVLNIMHVFFLVSLFVFSSSGDQGFSKDYIDIENQHMKSKSDSFLPSFLPLSFLSTSSSFLWHSDKGTAQK